MNTDVLFKGKKINIVFSLWPQGTVAVPQWLSSHGIYRQLADNYAKAGILQRFAHGAFVRPHDTIHWFGALYTLQEQLHYAVHVAGKTALQLPHFSCLKSQRSEPIVLFGVQGEKLPTWFKRSAWEVTFQYYKSNLFQHNRRLGLVPYETEHFPIRISTPERAIMEFLYLIPQKANFQEAAQLMGMLKDLRPVLVQSLLEDCMSVKVKRLFLFLAEAHQHAWVKELNRDRINLGSGKRMITKGGNFCSKYQLSVPALEKA